MKKITEGPTIGLLISAVQVVLILLRMLNIIEWHILFVMMPIILCVVTFIIWYIVLYIYYTIHLNG